MTQQGTPVAKPSVLTYAKFIMSLLVPVALAVKAVVPDAHHIDSNQWFLIVVTALGALVVAIVPNTTIMATAKAVIQILLLGVVAAQQAFQASGGWSDGRWWNVVIAGVGAILVFVVGNKNYRTVNAIAPH